LLASLKNIKCFAFDVDGVLTNGTVIVMPNGLLIRTMNIKDGYALQLAIKKGYHIWIISGGNSVEVEDRLKGLGVHEVHMRVGDKKSLLQDLSNQYHIPMDQILFMGDDMPDYEAMRLAGIPACPSDAAVEIKTISTYKAVTKGGEGCAREVIEKVLKLNDHWDTEDHIRAK
jgi:3-deoxy-D-manno-octulosonate 8-phosphate phosphatase (KDO 8-P phosphatase)